jgi:protein LTV1
MDDFLENYEVVGRKYRPALGGTGLTGPEKLSVLRSAIEGEDEDREENRRRVLEVERTTRGKEKIQRERVKREEDEGDKWDVETILSECGAASRSEAERRSVSDPLADISATYTNTENHPGMIRSRSAAQTKARAEARARAEAEAEAKAAAAAAAAAAAESDSSDSGSETERETPRVTVARPKGEAAEERRARKAAVKAERSVSAASRRLRSHMPRLSHFIIL